MKITFRAFRGEYDWGWVRSKVAVLRVQDTGGIMAIDEEKNQTVGAVIFDNWTHNAVQMHLALENSMVLRHGFFEEVFDYVFNFRGKNKAYAYVTEDNERAIRLNKKLGGEVVARLKDGWAVGTDYLLFELKKENFIYWDRIKKFNEAA